MPLGEGETFAGYRVVRKLGAGGMGEVYLAEHPRLPRRDALKLLASDVSVDASFRERFLREADLASTLWHPHIVGVHDRGEHEGQLWISMDFVDGEDADSLMARRYPTGMPVELVVAIVTAMAAALDHAHNQGLLHRDVKPANIMLANVDDAAHRRILLTDFGIARTLDDNSGLTGTNMTIGTVAYASPEQLMGEVIDGRADQYSLAATAYHLLTGDPPYGRSNPAAVIGRHLNTAPPTLADARAELVPLGSALAAALAKSPQQRYATCCEFARALAPPTAPTMSAPVVPTAPTQVSAQPQPPVPLAPGWYQAGRSDAPVFWSIGIGAVVVAIIGAVVFLWTQSSDPRPSVASSNTKADSEPVAAEDEPAVVVPGGESVPEPVSPPVPQPVTATGVITGTCDEGGSCGVKQRTAPYTDAPRLHPNDLYDGATVTLVCQTTGDVRVNSGHGSSNVWYRLDNGAYVNLVYFTVPAPSLPSC